MSKELIEQAVERLKELKAIANYKVSGDLIIHIFLGTAKPVIKDTLLATLHRTIDAQIHLLEETIRVCEGVSRGYGGGLEESILDKGFEPQIRLAKALLGVK